MIYAGFVRITALATLAAAFPVVVGAQARTHVEKAYVHFLATSTLVRGTYGYNQDVFLVELRFSAHGESLLARLIDEYPNLSPPLATRDLRSPSGIVFWVRRDAKCDLPYAEVLLRTAPGDAMALLHEKLGYQPHLEKTPGPDEVMPCYRTAKR